MASKGNFKWIDNLLKRHALSRTHLSLLLSKTLGTVRNPLKQSHRKMKSVRSSVPTRNGGLLSRVTHLLVSIVLFIPVPTSAQDTPWPGENWNTASPESQGVNGSVFSELDQRIRAGDYGYVDRMVVIRNGHLLVNERYDNDYREITRGFTGPLGCGWEACTDESQLHQFNYYHPDFHPYEHGRDIHSLQSVTKSVSATMIGVALTLGLIESVDIPFVSFFKDYDLSGIDDRLNKSTLADLLTMRSGIEWHEQDRPLDETNTTIQLELSDDWIQFTFDQPMDSDPGAKWVYNSGGSHLMSGIIKKVSGQFLDEFAEEHVFGPLRIREYHWKKTAKGHPDGLGGLYLEAVDLARIGYLYLRGGVWNGRRILSESWVQNATDKWVENVNREGFGYGFQWWRLDRDNTVIWAGLGFGGQYLLVLPELDLVAVINSWNLYGRPEKRILNDFLDGLIGSVQ